MKPNFTMLIGPAGCGKSTLADSFWSSDKYEIVSSDEIREELYGDAAVQGNPREVFEIMHSRTIKCLEEGIHVIYDATNLTYKNRKSILDKVTPLALCTAIIVATPLDIILEQNRSRERVVPEEVIMRQLCQFEMPTISEGFDVVRVFHNINAVFPSAFDEFLKMCQFDQHNSHHSMDLGNHCAVAYKAIKTDEEWLRQAALFHDYGKLYTQTFHTMKGEKTEDAHYYGHPNIGSYLCLSIELFLEEAKMQHMAVVICYHMQPYFSKTEKSINKWKARLGEKMWNYIMLLHEADKEAH